MEHNLPKRIFVKLIDIVTAVIDPIKLHYKLTVQKSIKRKMRETNDISLTNSMKENAKIIQKLEEEHFRHIRLQQGLETIYQLIVTIILLLCANSDTKTSQGLNALFETNSINFIGISISPTFVMIINVALNFLSFSLANTNGTRANNYNFPLLSKFVLGISTICSCMARIMSITLYFAPALGLFDLLFHYKGMYILSDDYVLLAP